MVAPGTPDFERGCVLSSSDTSCWRILTVGVFHMYKQWVCVVSSSSLLLSSLELSDAKKYMSIEYEPASEMLHDSAK